jgi:adenylate cyclase
MLEIERKFLVEDGAFLEGRAGTEIEQGYIAVGENVVRVRIAGDEARLTLKRNVNGLVRLEYEYPIPVDDARELLERLCGGRVIRKRRFRIEYAGHIWEVDIFHERYAGLLLAEIELESVDEEVELPGWVGREVTRDPRYFNAALACGAGLEELS